MSQAKTWRGRCVAETGCAGAPAGIRREATGCAGAPAGIRREATGCAGAPAGIRREATGCAGAPAGIRREATGCAGALAGIRREATGCAGALAGIRREASAFRVSAAPALSIAVASLLLTACAPQELATLPEIDTSGSPDGIVELPADVPDVFHTYFDRYAYVPTPDGRRIHFLVSSAWTRDQIKHGLNVMEHLLADHPGSVYGDDKSGIAAAMADRKATMVFFDNEPDMRQAMSEGLPEATDLSMQDLRANEAPAPGDADYMGHVTRDAAYEEIWHLIHDYGIKPTLPEMIAEMRTANDAAAEQGWYAWPRDVPDDHPNEYVGALIDNYYDLWTVPPTVYEGRPIEPDEIPDGYSHFGQYFAGSRAAMPEKDPLGYALVTGFVGPHLTYTPELPLDFSGTFSMAFDPEVRYTMKTQHLRNVALTGDGDADLVGNAHDNVLTGNAGANRLEGGGGNDTLDGGDGVDTAVFSGPAADYEVTTGEDGVTVSDSQTDRDGVDTLRGVESLEFSDETVELE